MTINCILILQVGKIKNILNTVGNRERNDLLFPISPVVHA